MQKEEKKGEWKGKDIEVARGNKERKRTEIGKGIEKERERSSVAEPVEPKLFGGVGAEAVMSYFGSGSTVPEPKISF